MVNLLLGEQGAIDNFKQIYFFESKFLSFYTIYEC